MNGYELPIAMEVRRGRYLRSYEQPEPLTANKPELWQIPLRDHDHVFLEGPPVHGAGTIHLVSGDRPQPTGFCAQHLPGKSNRLRSSDATYLLLSRDALPPGAAGHAVEYGCGGECQSGCRDGGFMVPQPGEKCDR